MLRRNVGLRVGVLRRGRKDGGGGGGSGGGGGGTDYGNFRPQIPGTHLSDISGGRGGDLIRVTSRANRGAGTLREALEASGPRCIVFEVGGYFDGSYDDPIVISNPHFTVAGQTAPAPGVFLRNMPIAAETHNGIFQHLTFCHGVTGGYDHTRSLILSWNTSTAYNYIIDHCSFVWSPGTTVVTPYSVNGDASGNHNVGIWRTLIGEGLTTDGNSMALLIGNLGKRVTIYQSILASHEDRMPYTKGGAVGEMADCLIYQWGTNAAYVTSLLDTADAPFTWQIRSCHFRTGPDTDSSYMVRSIGAIDGSALYLDDLYLDSHFQEFYIEEWAQTGGIDPRVANPVVDYGYTPMGSGALLTTLPVLVGARPSARSAIDTRILDDVINRTGALITSESAVGGFPSLSDTSQSWSDASNPNDVAPGQTFRTNREMKLESEALALEE